MSIPSTARMADTGAPAIQLIDVNKWYGEFQALRDINLTKIESRPLKGRPFEYSFYVDILASPREENCANAMAHLAEVTEFLAVLGSYEPASVPGGN